MFTLGAQCTPAWDVTGAVPGFDSAIIDMQQTAGGLFGVGGFTDINGQTITNVARWDGTAWQAAGTLGTPASQVRQLLLTSSGTLLACGSFGFFPLSPSADIASFDGTDWNPASPGFTGGSVFAMTELANGDLVVGGNFTSVGGVTANNLAISSGGSWSALPQNIGNVTTLATHSNGSAVYVGGNFTTTLAGNTYNRIGVWSGLSWSPLGSGLNGPVDCMKVLDNGDLIVGGGFSTAGGVPTGGIARWSGGTWSALGAGLSGGVAAIDILPSGDLVAGGLFTANGNPNIQNIARFDEATSSWIELIPTGSAARTWSFEITPAGELAVGTSATAGGVQSGGFARLISGCPATTTSTGAGCLGLGGTPLTLTADSLAWTGATIQFSASGFGNTALGMTVLGAGPLNISLQAVPELGAADPSCQGLVTPDIVNLDAPQNGVLSWSITIPNDPTVFGIPLFHQALELEFGATGITFAASTNSLTTTVGVF